MNIPRLGETRKNQFGDDVSTPVNVPMLRGLSCEFIIEGYEEDVQREDFHSAIANFLSETNTALLDSAPHIFDYYQDIKECVAGPDDEFFEIEDPDGIWRHIQLGQNPVVSRRDCGDRSVYISLECNCDWEPEHGLQIVFRAGEEVTKIGPYDGHLAHSDAYTDVDLEGVVYRRRA